MRVYSEHAMLKGAKGGERNQGRCSINVGSELELKNGECSEKKPREKRGSKRTP